MNVTEFLIQNLIIIYPSLYQYFFEMDNVDINELPKSDYKLNKNL